MNPLPEVVVESLSVEYPGGVLALDHLDLTVRQGMFGLLGPNGAGKTTLMRTLAALQPPTAGRATFCGRDTQRDAAWLRRSLGYLPQDFQTYPQLKVWEVLDFYAILNEITDSGARRNRIDALLEQVGLHDVRARKSGQLSGGMLRRLGVAQALINDPRLLILDEPTVGLDPAERIHFRNFIGELSRDRVVILSTHIVSDIGSACESLAVLDRGRLRFTGKRQELVDRVNGKVWRVVVDDGQYARYRERFAITGMVETSEGMELKVIADAPEATRWQPAAPNLEDAYLWLLGAVDRPRTASAVAHS